jgi:plastocyanin
MTPTPRREAKLHAVSVRIDGKGFIYSTPENPNATSIVVRPGDKVKWNCGHGNYSILFKNESPFTDIGAHARGGADTEVLTIVGKAGSYKYAVNVALPNGLVVDDPEIIVGDGGD